MSRNNTTVYRQVSREILREIYQPSRITLAIVPKNSKSEYNVIPLCFHSWCSYSPLLYCVAIQRANYSRELFENSDEFALAIPGENLLEIVTYCGTHSGKSTDKTKACNIDWSNSNEIQTPGINGALANLELKILQKLPTGDHLMVVGEVVSISLSNIIDQRLLLSIDPKTEGYQILWTNDIHTIGVISNED